MNDVLRGKLQQPPLKVQSLMLLMRFRNWTNYQRGVEIHDLLTHSLFASDILRRLLLHVSLGKPTSAAWPY